MWIDWNNERDAKETERPYARRSSKHQADQSVSELKSGSGDDLPKDGPAYVSSAAELYPY